MAAQFIESGRYKKVLVVGSDKMSSITDYTDRNTCVLFGDAAAAVGLEVSDDPNLGLIDSLLNFGQACGTVLFNPLTNRFSLVISIKLNFQYLKVNIEK